MQINAKLMYNSRAFRSLSWPMQTTTTVRMPEFIIYYTRYERPVHPSDSLTNIAKLANPHHQDHVHPARLPAIPYLSQIFNQDLDVKGWVRVRGLGLAWWKWKKRRESDRLRIRVLGYRGEEEEEVVERRKRELVGDNEKEFWTANYGEVWK